MKKISEKLKIEKMNKVELTNVKGGRKAPKVMDEVTVQSIASIR